MRARCRLVVSFLSAVCPLLLVLLAAPDLAAPPVQAHEASAGAPVTPASPPVRLRIRFEQEPRQLLDELKLRGLDVTYVNAKRGTLDVIGGEAEVALLRTLGFDPEPVDAPLAPEALSDYLSPAEIENRLAQFESAYPSLARRIGYATDHQGRTAWALKISDNVTIEEDEPVVLYVAQHHASRSCSTSRSTTRARS